MATAQIFYDAADGHEHSLVVRHASFDTLAGRISGTVMTGSHSSPDRRSLRVRSSALSRVTSFAGTVADEVAINTPAVLAGAEALPADAELAGRRATARQSQPVAARAVPAPDPFVRGAQATVVGRDGIMSEVEIVAVRGNMVQARLRQPPHTPLLLSRDLDWTF